MRNSIALLLSIVLLLSTTSIVVFSIDGVNAAISTVYVDSSGGSDYIHIQDAINAADPGDIVYVYSGFYQENLIINKTITLIGEDKTNTTIDGRGSDAISISADGIEISGFTIRNGTNGIIINGSSENTITDNTIMNTDCGAYIDNKSSNNTIYNNNFLNNTKNAYDLATNIWYYSSIGNYWDDYTDIDSDDNGIGDTPYNISGGINQDIYPLVEPITEKPEAIFTYSPSGPTTQKIIQFNDISTDSDGYISSWSWNFGDGNTSIEQNATHKYANNGIYSITLEVTDNYGATNETAQQISILNVGPTADFDYSPKSPTDLQNVTFTDTSIDLDGKIVDWSWGFGDGKSSTLKNSSHKYDDNGTYTVTLVVTDDDGASDSTSQQIPISNAAPTASFYVSFENVTILVNDEIQFTDSSKDLDGNIISWHWDLGDGTTSTEKQLIHIYSSNGVYKVTLTVTDNDGASSTETKHITVSSLIEVHEIEKGFSTFDLVFVVFIIIMVAMVIILSKKYG